MRNTLRIRMAPKAYREDGHFVALERMTGKSMDSDINGGATRGRMVANTAPHGLKSVVCDTRQFEDR